jgi:DNA-directed RNA polymerase subunit K/omega
LDKDLDKEDLDLELELSETDDIDENEDIDSEINTGLDDSDKSKKLKKNKKSVKRGKKCIYENSKDKYLIFDNDDDDNLQIKHEIVRIPDEERITQNTCTYYELVRIIGVRTRQLSLGAPPFIKGMDGMDPMMIAIEELKRKATPFKIRRYLPNYKYEDWRVSELNIIYDINFV